MNEQEHLLTILGEECSEVAHRASKALRFGLSEMQPGESDDNKRRIEQELGDLMGVAEMLGLVVHEKDKVAKKAKVHKFLEYSRQIGTLHGSTVDEMDATNRLLDGLMRYALGEIDHRWAGECPEMDDKLSRDPACEVCNLLGPAKR